MKRKLSHHVPPGGGGGGAGGGDAIQRQLADSRSSEGRGAKSGWVTCPLCASVSTKRFALGRGIAAHLQSVHAPWNPGKAERTKRRRLLERKKREDAQIKNETSEVDFQVAPANDSQQAPVTDDPCASASERWDPSEQEIEDWNAKVVEILRSLEAQAAAVEESSSSPPTVSGVFFVAAGKDRTGNVTTEYRESLPPFLQASADGDLDRLQDMVTEARRAGDKALLDLLSTKDRHLSTCEHWAAGSGHLSCLRYLVETRKSLAPSGVDAAKPSDTGRRRKMRRRDGKTALHFAARNGHVDCIRYLVDECPDDVDEPSGDGTTPLHLACYGGQVEALELLVERGADVTRTNDWGCSAAHWVGMTQCPSKETVRQLCNRLRQHGVSFVERQKQGHTALHKAAQRKNQHVIEWMASPAVEGGAGLSEEEIRLAARRDAGGHTPSAIWQSVRGDASFGSWMSEQMKW